MSDPIETAREHLARTDDFADDGRVGSMPHLIRDLAEDVRALLGLLDEGTAGDAYQPCNHECNGCPTCDPGLTPKAPAQAHLPGATLSEEEREALERAVCTLGKVECAVLGHDHARHLNRLVPLVERILATRLAAQSESTTRVEWAVRCMMPGNEEHTGTPWKTKREAEESAERLRNIWRSGDAVPSAIDTIRVVRRTVTGHAPVVGPWTEIEAGDES